MPLQAVIITAGSAHGSSDAHGKRSGARSTIRSIDVRRQQIQRILFKTMIGGLSRGCMSMQKSLHKGFNCNAKLSIQDITVESTAVQDLTPVWVATSPPC